MRVVWIVLSLILAAPIHAQEAAVPPPPAVAAKSFYLMDASSGAVLAASASGEQLPPASLTKMMTGYAIFRALADGRIALEDRVLVSERAWRMPGSRMFIEVDTEVGVEDLLRGMIIQSGNDAAVALAEHVAGSVEAFVDLMNEHARALGMMNTAFRNPTGLPAREHYSTARDLAILAKAIIDEFPDYYLLYREREFTYNGIRQYNRNALLRRDASVDGMKTGHTNAAGYCLVASAERSGMRLIAVVLGMQTPSARTSGSAALLNYGFESFETHKLFTRGEAVTEARIWKGEPQTAQFGIPQDLYVTIPRGRFGDLGATMELPVELVAPIDAAAQVGEVRVAFQGESLAVLPLISLQPVSEAGLWTRMSNGFMFWLDQP
jgi:D-alanyl-D-alanine carboxypeptidase (penicillin-binding protein 5/6)